MQYSNISTKKDICKDNIKKYRKKKRKEALKE